MNRSLTLFYMFIKSVIRKIQHDLSREIVVAICAGIILALFAHIFNDFINREIKNISIDLQHTLGQVFNLIISLSAAIWAGRQLSSLLNADNSISLWGAYLGEEPNTIRIFKSLTVFIFASTLIFAIHFSLIYLLPPWTWTPLWVKLGGMMVIIAGLSIGKTSPHQIEVNRRNFQYHSHHPSKALILWRILMGWKFHRLARFCFIISVILMTLCILTLRFPTSFYPTALIAFISSLFMTIGLAAQFSDDLSYAWFEMNTGVSHNQYLIALLKASMIQLSLPALFFLFIYSLHSLFQVQVLKWDEILKAIGLIYTPGLCLCLVFFQIEPRKPAVLVISMLLISLFAATALLASLLGFALWPVILYYCFASQQDRLYQISE